MTSSTYNNGVSDMRAYNTDNTLTSISFAGASIGNLTYGCDANKNKTSEAIAGPMSNYGFTVPTNGYDSEDRLVGFNRTSGLTQSWNLSAVGDWNSVTTNGSTETRTHGPTHELLTAGGQNVSTDTKGNITLIPARLRLNASSLASVWDFDNRLNTADIGNNGSIDVTYKFDALGRRVFRDDGTSATVYVQAGQQTIADYTAGTAASSPTYRYVYASYIDEPVLRYKPSASESLYYHRNQQYSVVALTNPSATIIERYAYTAYGVPTITNASGTVLPLGSVNNRYMYTGREWDSVLAQYHYRARIYDANLGRFASRDPIGYEGSKWALFAYSASKPMRLTDPHGEMALDPKDASDLFGCDGSCISQDVSIVPANINIGGFVECDGFGGFVAVVDPNGGDGDCTTTCGTEDCAKDHEDYHIAQFKLVCPYACKEPYCHIPVPKGWMVNILNAVCKEKMECQAYKVEIDCLKKKYNDLIGKGTTCTRKDGTMPKCTNYISALIRAKVAQANKDYGCQLVAR